MPFYGVGMKGKLQEMGCGLHFEGFNYGGTMEGLVWKSSFP